MSTPFSLFCWDLWKLSIPSGSYSTASRWSGVQSIKEMQRLRNAQVFAVIIGFTTAQPPTLPIVKAFLQRNTDRENKTVERSYTSTPSRINTAEYDLEAQRLQLQHADVWESSAHEGL